jgi:hypothetical protein
LTDPLYIRLGLTVRGPYTPSDLLELALRGSFSKSHEVSADKKSWTSASNHPELFPVARHHQSVKGKKQNADTTDGERDSKVPPVDSETSERLQAPPPASQTPDLASSQMTVDEASRLTGSTVPVRDLSKQTVGVAITGPVGFVLLLVCTAMIVMRLRSSPFRPSENIGLMILLCIDIVIGGVAVALGSFAIRLFHQHAGAVRERNLIVIGLSCGYTILILCILYSVVLLIAFEPFGK